MKILIANYRYFFSGGPERYMFNLMDELKIRGHGVVPFSIKYSKNIDTEYEKYFVNPLGGKEEILFKDQKTTLRSIYRTTKRLFYDPEVERAVIHLIKETKPDIAYVLHYLKKLSPAVLVGIKKMGLPIVVRLSDYLLVCPGTHCSRNNTPCDLCVSGNIFPSIRYRCVQNSLLASLLYASAMQYHRSQKFFDLIDRFVVTNDFMYKIMLQAGYPENKLKVIPTFVKVENNQGGKIYSNPPVIAIVGRIERIKGVHILLNALNQLRKHNPNLGFVVKIAGTGELKYINELKAFIWSNNLQNHISLVGELSHSQTYELLQNAFISIIPSIIYENLPNSLLESFASGTPVIGSDLGSLSSVIKDEYNGLLFRPNDEKDLAKNIKYCLDNPAMVSKMGENAKAMVKNEFSPEKHVSKLTTLFNELLSNSSCHPH